MDAATSTFRFESFDGVAIACRTLGSGPPALMLHGFLADAELNWVAPGVAQSVAGAGFQAIMPDLRGHGASDAPRELAAYPPDVLARDQEALLRHLGIEDFVLAGYSLGARTAVRMMARANAGLGPQPRRCALGGMGDDGVLASEQRRRFFEDSIRNGEQAADPRAGRYIQAVIRQRGLDPDALLGVLASFVPTTPDELASIEVPVLAVCGEADSDNGSAKGLAGLLGNARALAVSGDHLSAVADPALARAFAEHLRG